MPRVLGFYLIAAFTALQVAESLTSALDLPSWVPTLVAVLGIVGIPVVGVLAWVFDVTPDGVRRTSGAGGEAAASGGGRSWRIGAAVVAVVLGSWALTARLGDEPALRSDLVTVVPFRVSGEEVEYLGEGMVDLLAAKLTGEGGLRAVEPRTVLARWEGDGEGGARGTGGEDVARSLSRDLGAGRFLLGSVVAAGRTVMISGRILDTATAEELASQTVEGSRDSIAVLVDRFVARLLSHMAGVEPHRLTALAETPLPALRAYLDGQSLLRAGRFQESADAFSRALESDSTFALAGMYHSTASSFTTRWNRSGLDLAWRHRDRLSPRDRLHVTAMAGPRYPDWAPVSEELDMLARLTYEIPDRAEAWYERGDAVLHFDLARPVADRLERARGYFEKALELDPALAPAHFHLIDIALMQGDTAGARRFSRAFLDSEQQGEIAFYARWVLDRLDGSSDPGRVDTVSVPVMKIYVGMGSTAHGMGLAQSDSAIRSVIPTLTDAEAVEVGEAANYLLNRGRPAEARAVARRVDHEGSLTATVHRLYEDLYWEVGSPDEAEERVQRLERQLSPERDPTPGAPAEAACVAGQYRARAGHTALAGLHAAGLRRLSESAAGESWGRLARVCAVAIEAVVAVENGRENAATLVEELDGLHRENASPDPRLRDAVSILLAQLHERLGNHARALEATRRRVVLVRRIYFLSTQLREEGRLAARLGLRDDAADAYRRYLDLRSDPEPEVRPHVEQVRRELEALRADAP